MRDCQRSRDFAVDHVAKTFKALAVGCIGETPPGTGGIGNFCYYHCSINKLQLGIVHTVASEYAYGMHSLSTGTDNGTNMLTNRQLVCYSDTKYS